ncbi:MAG: putative peptidoglycan glycosyltransferase FtsW [Paracoccaceae bacterium]|nr:putative peptidoglycan glycosyltransferase FtsW [Paracoccaceae bacterium]MDE2915293.1 putative peptidoglycan glycosyltransferase FtsW [Paracoccaceae bacterium]
MTGIVFGPVAVSAGEPILPRWWQTVDRWSLACLLILAQIGLVMALASSPATAERNGLDPFHYFHRQAFYTGAAIALLVIVSMMRIELLRRLCILGFVVGLVALLLLPVFGTGFGQPAKRWFSLGFGSVQPSEFIKPCFVMVSAWFFVAVGKLGGQSGERISLLLAIGIAAILALQPDFGQASLFLAAWGVMYFVAGAPVLVLMVLAGATGIAGVVAYNTSEHFMRRIDLFLSGEPDPSSQLGFAVEALRNGGYFGVGVGEGQIKWSLPDAHTDFIIAVAAEEYGLVLVLFVILLFLVITVRSLLRLARERSPFIRIAGTGLMSMFALQALINMGVAARLLPAKGMTLPFISYGGSSALATAILMGVLLAFTRTRPQGDMEDAFALPDRRGLRAN